MDLDSKFRQPASPFARQFGEEGGQLVYRKHQKGPAVPVTEAERDAFIKRFHRSLWRLMWLVVPALLALAFIYVSTQPPDAYTRMEDQPGAYVSITLAIMGFVAAQYRLYGAPMRELKDRPPVAPALTKAEALAVRARQVSWAQIVIPLLLAVALVLSKASDPAAPAGWRWFWALFGAAILAVAVRSTYIKLRFGKAANAE
jgi:hypothetical protein